MIKRYGVKTKSGRWYYIEEHTHLLKHENWLVFIKKEKYHLLGLKFSYMDIAPTEIETRLIKSKKDFVNHRLIFAKHPRKEDMVWGTNINQTKKITEIIEFQ